jgi:hypothetical protein
MIPRRDGTAVVRPLSRDFARTEAHDEEAEYAGDERKAPSRRDDLGRETLSGTREKHERRPEGRGDVGMRDSNISTFSATNMSTR